jgi:peroxiredoxin
MAQFEPWKDSIEAFGGGLVFIAAEKRNGMFNPQKFLNEHPTSFPFLLDEDRSVTKAYGVYHRLGVDAINIAHPATFVVGRDAMIRYIYVGANQTDRAPIEQVLDALKKVANE